MVRVYRYFSPFCWSAAHHELSKAAFFAHENCQVIRATFATFLAAVRDKLFKNGVDTEQLRLFVTNQFPPGDCIVPPSASLTEIFEAITHHRLWDYFHYSPLVHIVQKFGDDEMKDWVQTYKKHLKAYIVVATLENYIEDDLDVADLPPAKRAKYDPHYYHPVKWENALIDHTLQYLGEVWELFSSHYLVPESPPTALVGRVYMALGGKITKVKCISKFYMNSFECAFQIVILDDRLTESSLVNLFCNAESAVLVGYLCN